MPRADARLLAIEDDISRCGSWSGKGACWDMWRGELSSVFVVVVGGDGVGSLGDVGLAGALGAGWTSWGRNLSSSASF